MVILVGALIGLLMGAAVCLRFVRQEMMANISPRLHRIELQLDTLRAELNLATETRLAALNKSIEQRQSPPGSTYRTIENTPET
jgi:hypothetical protein